MEGGEGGMKGRREREGWRGDGGKEGGREEGGRGRREMLTGLNTLSSI